MFNCSVIENLVSAKKIAVLTGAGVSAESGVPTFRGENGLWKKFRPEELANMNAFLNNPELVWEWYNYRKNLIMQVEPNPGHYSLVKMEYAVDEFTLITQNVDDLHFKAGSRNILELHGNIMRNRCLECNNQTEIVEPLEKGKLPRCKCGGLLRPDVVWFGEILPQDVLAKAFKASEGCDVFISIGTSALVQPAASLPLAAKDNGAFVIEINKDRTTISDIVDESFQGLSGEILPELTAEVWGEKQSGREEKNKEVY